MDMGLEIHGDFCSNAQFLLRVLVQVEWHNDVLEDVADANRTIQFVRVSGAQLFYQRSHPKLGLCDVLFITNDVYEIHDALERLSYNEGVLNCGVRNGREINGNEDAVLHEAVMSRGMEGKFTPWQEIQR